VQTKDHKTQHKKMLEVNRRELAHLQAPNEEEALEGQLEHRKLTGSDICSLEH
jgi:hypothetical protein